jgi:hypothetical protein
MTKKLVLVIALVLLSFVVALIIKFTQFYGIPKMQDESIPTAILDRNSIGGDLYSYFEKFNEYPQGSNAEIMLALDKEYFLSHYSSKRLNKKHEFMDSWGTPYEIRISPDGEFQLISAGPNKIFDNDDDKVLEAKLQ